MAEYPNYTIVGVCGVGGAILMSSSYYPPYIQVFGAVGLMLAFFFLGVIVGRRNK